MKLKIKRTDDDTESFDERTIVAVGGAIQFMAAFMMLAYMARIGMGLDGNTDPFFVGSVTLFLSGSLLALIGNYYERLTDGGTND